MLYVAAAIKYTEMYLLRFLLFFKSNNMNNFRCENQYLTTLPLKKTQNLPKTTN